MRFDRKESWRHLADKKRDHEIDRDDKTKVQKILREQFGLPTIRDEVLLIPKGGYRSIRIADLFVKSREPQIAIELHGEGPHGYGDLISEPEKDVRRYADYDLLLPGIKLIVLFSAQTDGYAKNLVTNCLLKQGLQLKT